MEDYGIAILGWGTVGGGVIDILNQEAECLQQRSGFNFQLHNIVTANPDRQREQSTMGAQLSSEINDILTNDAVKCVLHLVGGTGIAKDFVIQCLEAGKHVVTANKALLA
ncbi:MAG: homoserine dehydrogenase, partial [Planctomycetes bacterium]|nr:homoserine dehydrogenase [Planctomycetota bacterium]